MKAKSKLYGKGNKGGMKELGKGSVNASALKKGAMASAKEPMDASDSESADDMDEAPTSGLSKQSVGSNIHKMSANLMRDQDGMHDAAGFVSGKKY